MRLFVTLLAGVVLTSAPQAADRVVLGLQESGTALWEIAAIRALNLEVRHDIEIEVRALADSRAGQIALQAGAVDIILSDFTWVSAQRWQGAEFTMVPHSLAVGGLMVPAGQGEFALSNLEGATIAVAGGPADKSWVVLQAYYREETGRDLLADVDARFGAPPLVHELLAGGRVDAGLNFWHWNARAKAEGMLEALSVAQMFDNLGLDRPPPLLGWTFDSQAADTNPAIARFLDASFEAKAALLSDDVLWDGLAEVMGAADDQALFIALRDGYRAGIVPGYSPGDVEAAEAAFALLAKYGGSDVVGERPELAPGTFWSGYER